MWYTPPCPAVKVSYCFLCHCEGEYFSCTSPGLSWAAHLSKINRAKLQAINLKYIYCSKCLRTAPGFLQKEETEAAVKSSAAQRANNLRSLGRFHQYCTVLPATPCQVLPLYSSLCFSSSFPNLSMCVWILYSAEDIVIIILILCLHIQRPLMFLLPQIHLWHTFLF